MELDLGRKISIEEAKKNFESNEISAKVVRDISMAIFQSASLIVSIVAALQLFTNIDFVIQNEYQRNLFFSIGTLYLVLLVICIYLLLPIKWFTPFPNDYKKISNMLFDKTDNEVIDQFLVNYYEAIRVNNISMKYKKMGMFAACLLLVVIIALLLFLVAIRI